jgi:hypothetical protein
MSRSTAARVRRTSDRCHSGRSSWPHNRTCSTVGWHCRKLGKRLLHYRRDSTTSMGRCRNRLHSSGRRRHRTSCTTIPQHLLRRWRKRASRPGPSHRSNRPPHRWRRCCLRPSRLGRGWVGPIRAAQRGRRIFFPDTVASTWWRRCSCERAQRPARSRPKAEPPARVSILTILSLSREVLCRMAKTWASDFGPRTPGKAPIRALRTRA